MRDYYVDDLSEETGRLFEYRALNHMDVGEMVTQYMRSQFRENVDKRYARFCTQAWYEMAEHVACTTGTTEYDATLCEWLGYLYTFLQLYTGESSRVLMDKHPFSEMYVRSGVLHDLDMDLAVRKVAKSHE